MQILKHRARNTSYFPGYRNLQTSHGAKKYYLIYKKQGELLVHVEDGSAPSDGIAESAIYVWSLVEVCTKS